MTSEEIVERFGYKDNDPILWKDYDHILLHNRFKPTGDEAIDKQIVIHWWMNVYQPNSTRLTQGMYASWDSLLYKYFKFVRTDGINPELNQSAVKISCYNKEPIQPQIDELRLWLPFLKEQVDKYDKDKEPFKKVGVFEKTLGKYGDFYHLEINETKKEYRIFRGNSELFCLTNLGHCVKVVADRFYYKKRLN